MQTANSQTALSPEQQANNPLRRALQQCRRAFVAAAIFSCGINLLMLTGPLYMLQIYDRVLTSGSVQTLIVLSVFVLALNGFMGLFMFFRARVLGRIGMRLEHVLTRRASDLEIYSAALTGKGKILPLEDLGNIRRCISSPVLAAIFDIPWTPIFLGIVFFIHPWLGWMAVAGSLIVIAITFYSEKAVYKKTRESHEMHVKSSIYSSQRKNNSDQILTMGMMENTFNIWERFHLKSLIRSQQANGITEATISAAKAIRITLQSSILGLGAYLALQQYITPGSMIAASIIAGRALAPIDQLLAGWRMLVSARQAYGRLGQVLNANTGQEADKQSLPAPKGYVSLSGVTKTGSNIGSGETSIILNNIHFELQPGDGLGVIGPSSSGKTSLARLLIGLWTPERGSVRLDGATLHQWDREKLGRHIGYLPQKVELLPGTVGENICRFIPDTRSEDIIAAAELAGVHKLVLSLRDGYDTRIGDNGQLSGGQVQRIALARAVFGMPALIVLDEPNSNLDADGDAALTRAISSLREADRTVIVMAHRPGAIAAVNKILLLRNGNQVEFGPKSEVLSKVSQKPNLVPTSTAYRTGKL